MKMIHCADLHLDSELNQHLSGKKRKERQNEILSSFCRMVEYGEKNEVEAVLIAGDLFDGNEISRTVKMTVWKTIENHPKLCFYYLRGNHDARGFWEDMGTIPDNLKLFGKGWSYYSQPSKKGQIVIAGAELDEENVSALCTSLYLPPDACNIVLLHGQEGEYRGKEGTVMVPRRELQGRHIDYLALGHVHSYKWGELDARGRWCYPGCLEGRGFDECGEHGFVLLHIEEETGIIHHEFVPFSVRNLYTVFVDISECDHTEAIRKEVDKKLKEQGCSPASLVKVVLQGTFPVDGEKNLDYLKARLEDRFYFLKLTDKSRMNLSQSTYVWDETLKGEFVRFVLGAEEIPEEEKEAVILYGIRALSGEEL